MNETPETRKIDSNRSFTSLFENAREFAVNQRLGLLVGLVLGVILLAVWHVARFSDHHTHYHANFALYVNGVRDEFKSPTYYEEVQACGTDLNNPRGRVHLHDNDPSAVHVHDAAATWGALLANLGYGATDNVLKTSQGTFVSGTDGKQVSYILNGRQVFDIANRTIGDKDVLLISYGNESMSEQQKHFDAIPRTAAAHDATSDPATCSGSAPTTFVDRLKSAFAIPSQRHED